MNLDQIDLAEFLADEGVATSTRQAAWRKVRAQASEAVSELGVGRVSTMFGMSESGLLHALAERNRTRLSAEQLVTLQIASKHITLAAMVPRMRGYEVVPAKPMTPEEELARWRSLADRMGDHGQWMREQVYDRKVKP